MLDIFDFIVEKGGDPKKIKESQRRRYAPEEAVDEVIALYEDHRKSELSSHAVLLRCPFTDTNLSAAQYSVSQLNTKINDVQKQIGAKKRVS